MFEHISKFVEARRQFTFNNIKSTPLTLSKFAYCRSKRASTRCNSVEVRLEENMTPKFNGGRGGISSFEEEILWFPLRGNHKRRGHMSSCSKTRKKTPPIRLEDSPDSCMATKAEKDSLVWQPRTVRGGSPPAPARAAATALQRPSNRISFFSAFTPDRPKKTHSNIVKTPMRSPKSNA